MPTGTDKLIVTDPVAVAAAGARKEFAYLRKFGRPLHPFQRLYREDLDYKVFPSEYIHSLETYLQAVPYIVPTDDASLTRPILRHPDLEPNNVLISDDLNIITKLPPNSDELSEQEQSEQVSVLRERQLH